MEYLSGGDLFDRISRKGKYTEKDASIIICRLTQAIQTLHNNRIIHRDLKPENILLKGSV